MGNGNRYRSLGFHFIVAYNIILEIVNNVFNVITPEYTPKVIQSIAIPEEWEEIAWESDEHWNFSYVSEALDIKHIEIRCPNRDGGIYFDYKNYHSSILLALVGANYGNSEMDKGGNGSCSGGQVSQHSELCEDL